MGQKSRLKQQRRVLRQQHMLETRQAHEAHMRDPLYLLESARVTDDQVLELAAKDKAVQAERLQRAGWRQRYDSDDGVGMWDQPGRRLRIVHSVSREPDGEIWAHLSISREGNFLPDWYQVRDAQRLLYPFGVGHIVIVPETEHVNEANVHHVWTCLTKQVLPDFRKMGSI